MFFPRKGEFFPSILLTGQGGYQSSALVSLFQPHAAFFSVVGGLTQPIFDGGRILGNFEFTKARQDELLQAYRKTVVSAFADVDNALVSIRETSAKLRLVYGSAAVGSPLLNSRLEYSCNVSIRPVRSQMKSGCCWMSVS